MSEAIMSASPTPAPYITNFQRTPYHTTTLHNVPSWRSIDGWFNFPTFYTVIARQLANLPDTAIAVEIGAWLGQSSAFFADQLKKLNARHVFFYAVDTWKGSPTEASHQGVVAQHGGDLFPAWQKNMVRCGVEEWVKPIRESSVDAARQFTDGSVDFVFIDGDHRYDMVLADIKAWLPKIRSGGCISGHDYDWGGVRRAIDEVFGERVRMWGGTTCWLVDGV